MKHTFSSVDELLKKEPFSLTEHQKKDIFKNALIEELKFHYKNNNLYRQYCDKLKFNIENFEGNISILPILPVQIFKVLGSTLISVDVNVIKHKLTSSATSGLASTVMVDNITAKRQSVSMVKILSDFIGKKRKKFFILDLSPEENKESIMNARGAAIRGYLKFSSSVEYFLSNDLNDQLMFNYKKFFKHVLNLNKNEPIIIFGFTYVLYFLCIKILLEKKEDFTLPPGSKVIHIGGWKNLEEKKISKNQFNNEISRLFNIEEEDVIDIYGFTEQMGLNYPDCSEGWKHIPIYSDLIVRDPLSKNILPNGKTGILQFLSPIPHSYPGNIVQTDDVGYIDGHNDETCKCGRVGKRFKIIGRKKKAEIRGCGDVMQTKLFANQVDSLSVVKNNKLEILYFSNMPKIKKLSNLEKFDLILNSVNSKKKWLIGQPIDAIIGLIAQVNMKWQSPDKELSSFKERGLTFLSQWCLPNRLRELSDFSLRGKRTYIDGFQSMENSSIRYLKATPRGLACHWLSGNVPILGMLTLIQSILTKNLNIIKVSSSYSNIIPDLLKSFENETFTTRGGYTIHGNDLLETIAVVYFPHENKEIANTFSSSADIRIAWGGSLAVNNICSLPKLWHAQDLIFGPKLSFMVISSNALNNERNLKKILRRASTDISVFDQTACSSPHTIFVEDGGIVNSFQFAELLSLEMEKALKRIPSYEDDILKFQEVETIRNLYSFIGDVWGDKEGKWTVLHDKNLSLDPPTYSRVIKIKPVKDIMQTLEFVDSSIQTIGLAATGEKKLLFAEKATNLGVDRCPDLGQMVNFESPWDGIISMDRMVRWNTLGGPV